MSRRYVVLADDLTGACDTAVKFASRERPVRLTLTGLGAVAGDNDSDVLAYSTESRSLPPAEAYRRTCAAAEAAMGRLIYKKVDSTLRGNVGSEIDALLNTMPARIALLCPTLPSQGRTVVGGHLLVDGVPVSQTPTGDDRFTPVRHSHIPTVLAEQSQRRIGTVPLTCVRAGPAAVANRFRALADGGISIIVADAQSESDLRCLTEASTDLRRSFVMCGSAGLAELLAPETSSPFRPSAPIAPVVGVVGSINPVALSQATTLSRKARWPFLRVDLRAALRGGSQWAAWCAEMRAVLAKLETLKSGVVVAVGGDDAMRQQSATGRGAQVRETGDLISRRIAEAAEIAIDVMKARGALVTGGETAAALLRRLDAAAVELVGELDAGVPFGWINGGSRDGLAIATKAGGFGGSDVLWRAACRLTGGTESC